MNQSLTHTHAHTVLVSRRGSVLVQVCTWDQLRFKRTRVLSLQVFQDKCCKREISSLEVFCTNSPACTSVATLHQLQVDLTDQQSVCECALCRPCQSSHRYTELADGGR